MKEHPEHVKQAGKLIETGHCDLPVDWQNLADMVRRHPNFPYALKAFYQKGTSQTLRLITEVSAMKLCEDFSDEDNNFNNYPDIGVNSIEY